MSNDFRIDIPNMCTPGSGLCTGGKPRPEHLEEAARQGVKVVINFCPPAEAADYDEASVVTALGMQYVNIPVAGPQDLTPGNVKRFADALQIPGDEHRVLVHCASGNRAGAMFALKARQIDGASAENALALGRAAGLTMLEPFVTQVLQSS